MMIKIITMIIIIITIIIVIIIITTVINDNAYIPILSISPRGSWRTHISPDLSKMTGIFPMKIVRN